MKNYLCVLGRDPKLSLLEIVSYCKRKNIDYVLHSSTSTIAHFSFAYMPKIKELGGTVKIAEETTLEKITPDNNKKTFFKSFAPYGKSKASRPCRNMQPCATFHHQKQRI